MKIVVALELLNNYIERIRPTNTLVSVITTPSTLSQLTQILNQ